VQQLCLKVHQLQIQKHLLGKEEILYQIDKNHVLSFIRLTHELREDFDTALQGNNLKEADLRTLTGGARIANIFRERFPFELIKVLKNK
jgi:hypothetical protein